LAVDRRLASRDAARRGNVMHAELIQHPVGQGGLFSGILQDDHSRFRWAYDCGSNQRDALLREIASLGHDKLDLLFLSHLDSDHVNGIDALLAACQVEEVVLPYLLPEALAVILARDAATGTLTGSMIDLASDLPRWFGSRGVQRITFVGYGEDGGGDTGPPPDPPRPEGRPEGPIQCDWLPKPQKLHERLETDGIGQHIRFSLWQAAANAALFASQGMAAINWALIPHVHPPEAAPMSAFRDALMREFGTSDIVVISNAARTGGGRAKLRFCYDSLWLDHNLVSMTLYAGPAWDRNIGALIEKKRYSFHSDAGGWLLTGDAHLGRERRRKALFRRYASVIDQVGVLLLPHHGAAHNFDAALLAGLPHLRLAIAAAGPNGYGHPHRAVKTAVRAHGSIFRRVSEKPRSRIEARVDDR
jgi:beta-lactamase superfamily II metal-dependent hydrolase